MGSREGADESRQAHGVIFEEAATVFQDPRMVSVFNGEHSHTENRWATLGLSALGRLLVVCHTFQEISKDSATIRIISTRKATRRETRKYDGR
jgi:uncharacterized DUF497 family protein